MELHNLSSPSPLPLSPSMATTALGSPAPCLPTSSAKVSAFLVPVLCLEFILGLVGNGVAFLVFCIYSRPWSSNVVFLVSLVVADFLLIVNLPLRVDYYLHRETWRFGPAACKVNLFMLSTNRSASVVFLSAIALNRYLKVVWPHHALSRASGRAAAQVAGGLWGGLLLLNGHLFVMTHPRQSCLSYRLGRQSSAGLRWHHALYLLEFFATLALILFATVSIGVTIRRRGLGAQAGPRRAMRVLAMVVAVFTICFLPSVLFGVASIVAFRLHACRALDVCSQLFHGSLAFTYLNSVLDPVLYCFSSPSFFRQCRALLGLLQGSQDLASDDSSSQRPARLQGPPSKAEAPGRLHT
ncbi:oxoeicosanoid receptor 1 [Molossus nigricans]